MLSAAIDLAPGYSEALSLRARLELGDRAQRRAAIEDLRAAVAGGSWTRTDTAEAEQSLASVLLRTAKLAEARALLEVLAAAHPEDFRNLILLARLHAKAGDTVREGKVLAEAAVRFPLVEDFALLSSERDERDGRKTAARGTVATALKVHPDSLPLLLRAARLEADAAGRLAAVDLYTRKGGKDPLAAVLALESKPKDPGKYLTLFLDGGGLARQDLAGRAVLSAAASKAVSGLLASALAGFNGARDLDRDGDGDWEERWIFESGVPVRWIRDSDQDGVPELLADFSGGAASAISGEIGPDISMALRFSRYPYVESARVRSADALREYSLVPYTLAVVFLEAGAKTAAGISPPIASSVTLPSIDRVVRGSFLVEELGTDGATVVRRTDLADGVPVYTSESMRADGILDHRLWYADGKPVRGLRDLTGDGIFEVAETWEDGRLSRQSIDTDGDGTPDYREEFGAVVTRYWDFNEDGMDDSRERDAGDGKVIRDFSTAMDSRFDLSVIFGSEGIVGISRNGVPLPIIADAVRGITWIGAKPAAPVRVERTLGEGFHVIGGREYLVFRHREAVYAEALR